MLILFSIFPTQRTKESNIKPPLLLYMPLGTDFLSFLIVQTSFREYWCAHQVFFLSIPNHFLIQLNIVTKLHKQFKKSST